MGEREGEGGGERGGGREVGGGGGGGEREGEGERENWNNILSQTAAAYWWNWADITCSAPQSSDDQ